MRRPKGLGALCTAVALARRLLSHGPTRCADITPATNAAFHCVAGPQLAFSCPPNCFRSAPAILARHARAPPWASRRRCPHRGPGLRRRCLPRFLFPPSTPPCRRCPRPPLPNLRRRRPRPFRTGPQPRRRRPRAVLSIPASAQHGAATCCARPSLARPFGAIGITYSWWRRPSRVCGTRTRTPSFFTSGRCAPSCGASTASWAFTGAAFSPARTRVSAATRSTSSACTGHLWPTTASGSSSASRRAQYRRALAALSGSSSSYGFPGVTASLAVRAPAAASTCCTRLTLGAALHFYVARESAARTANTSAQRRRGRRRAAVLCLLGQVASQLSMRDHFPDTNIFLNKKKNKTLRK